MDKIKNEVDKIEQQLNSTQLAKDMLKELHNRSEKSADHNAKVQKSMIMAFVLSVICNVIITCVFMYGWLQYDYTTTETNSETSEIDATGIYNAIDESGNIVTSDSLSEEQFNNYLEYLDKMKKENTANGNAPSEKNQN
jgi:hypothetical protein